MTQKELHNLRLEKEAETAYIRMHTRRHFLKESAMGLGALGIRFIVHRCGAKNHSIIHHVVFDPAHPLAPKLPMFPGKAKSVIYLHMAGAPSQLELFDYKPELMKLDGQDCPQSLLGRKTFCIYPWRSKNVGPAGQICATW